MQRYRIANTELQLSRIGYGCMTIGGAWDRTPPTADTISHAARLVQLACEQGINLFDHADIYTLGKSEVVFGEVMHQSPGLRDSIVLQSKCGIRFEGDPNPDSPARFDFSYAHIIASVEGILRRLGTDFLDILLLHRPDPLVEPEEVARAFSELHASGKVRYFGVSNHHGGQIALLQQALDQPLVVNQLQLNLIHSHLINDGINVNQEGVPYAAATGVLDFCRLHNITVQAWAPVAGGVVSNPPADAEPRVRDAAAAVAALAEAKGVSREAIQMAWLLRHPAGIQPIIGTTTPERLLASCEGDGVELSREEWYRLFRAGRGSRLP